MSSPNQIVTPGELNVYFPNGAVALVDVHNPNNVSADLLSRVVGYDKVNPSVTPYVSLEDGIGHAVAADKYATLEASWPVLSLLGHVGIDPDDQLY